MFYVKQYLLQWRSSIISQMDDILFTIVDNPTMLMFKEEKEMESLRILSRTIKSINSDYLIKLTKVLRQDKEIHFLYEYCDLSVQSHIAKSAFSQVKRLLSQLTCVLQCLTEVGLKADIHLYNLGIDSHGNLKLFITPDCQIIGDYNQLYQFYCTEKTRLRFEMQDVYERFQRQNHSQDMKPQKNYNFIIKGNQLVFLKNAAVKHQEEFTNTSSKDSTHTPSQLTRSKKEIVNNTSLARNIISQIQRQKQRAENLRAKRPNSRLEPDQTCTGKIGKYSSPNSKDKDLPFSEKHSLKILSKDSLAESQPSSNRRDSHRNSSGCQNILQHIKRAEERMCNSATNKFEQKPQKIKSTDDFCRMQDRPNSSIKDETRDSWKYPQMTPLQRNSQNKIMLTSDVQQPEEQKIHVTTEMVSKYKMKIVTCQQIQFQGKEGDDIEKLAHQKLVQYQSQHGLPSLLFQNHNSSPQDSNNNSQKQMQIYEERNQYKQSVKSGQERGLPTANEQIIAKIMKAKEKASSALKQYKKQKK